MGMILFSFSYLSSNGDKYELFHYRITQALENRKEFELFTSSNSYYYYFYHCIGYHLLESNNLDLFPKLFLDFAFLGEKLRSDGFSYTIGDLKYYRKQITSKYWSLV